MIRIPISILSPVIALTMIACARDHVVKPAATAPAPISETRTSSATIPLTTSSGINVSVELRRACESHLGSLERAPKFDFDRSEVRDEERTVLQDVAACVTTGPLKGRSLRLVGRADPRGESEYNLALGHARAASVRSYLEQLGVNGSSISTTSRGNFDATGTDEASWQIDRRVDLGLD